MIERSLQLEKVLGRKYSAFLFGARGTGKTRLSKEFAQSVETAPEAYFDLLNGDLYRRYTTSSHAFYHEVEFLLSRRTESKGPLLVTIDEVQKVPLLLDEVHALIEEYKDKVQFLLTGSSARKLKRSGANLLAGRALSLRLHPLCSMEIDLHLERALQFGTLPSVYLDEDGEVVPVLRSYVETYLKEEVLQEALVRNIESFSRFLDIAGQSNGEPVNFSKIARAVKVSDKTVREYYEILCDTLIAYQLPSWSYSVRAQLAQAPKYYLFDTGVLNVLKGEIRTELKRATYRFGKLFENFIVNEFIRINDYKDTGFRFAHWRTHGGDEVDIILSRGASDRPRAVEIKSHETPTEKDLIGLTKFQDEHPESLLYCICLTARPYRIGNIEVLPWKSGIQEIIETE